MTDTGRMGRAELLARIAELEADNARLAKNHGIMLENLTSVQARCTSLLDECRGMRWLDGGMFGANDSNAGFNAGLRAIVRAAYAAECKHGAFHPRLTGIRDVTIDDLILLGLNPADLTALRSRVQTACTAAEKDGSVSWGLLAIEELLETLEAAVDGDAVALRTEIAQLGAVCAAWIRAIDERGAK